MYILLYILCYLIYGRHHWHTCTFRRSTVPQVCVSHDHVHMSWILDDYNRIDDLLLPCRLSKSLADLYQMPWLQEYIDGITHCFLDLHLLPPHALLSLVTAAGHHLRNYLIEKL